jgi:arsenate reductase (glutaredoxin)
MKLRALVPEAPMRLSMAQPTGYQQQHFAACLGKRAVHWNRTTMAKPVTIYGIKNCDTMKKARAWLDKRGVTYAFHDYKSAGIERDVLEGWAGEVGWDTLINRAGRTFRALPEKDQVGLTEKRAIALMAAQPSMIKRPVLDVGGKLFVGFKPEQYEKLFGAAR